MKTFTYTIIDQLGIHARPAGLLVKTVKNFSSEITIEKGDRKIKADKLMMLMGLGVKCGDKVKITAEGADEDEAINAMEKFFSTNL